MQLIKKIRSYKTRLMISTALTAAVWITPVSPALTANIESIKSFPSNGISDGSDYYLSDGTTSGTNPSMSMEGETLISVTDEDKGVYTPASSLSYPNGYYSTTSSGITIKKVSGTPHFVFNNGGVLWDISGYTNVSKDNEYFAIGINVDDKLLKYDKNEINSNIAISNGKFEGAIDIRKGSPVHYFYTCTDNENGCEGSNEHTVTSQGNINISGGNFYVSQNSQIKMYASNSGGINISGGNWFVGQDVSGNAPTADLLITAPGNTISITGGQFAINEGQTLTLQGQTGSISAQSATYRFSGGGTLALDFRDGNNPGVFTIGSALAWNEGNITQVKGTLNINAPVTIHGFNQDSTATLNISSVLSIENSIEMNGNLIGSGELKLSDKANATFGKLNNFGTISLGKGFVKFSDGVTQDITLSLSTLNGTDLADPSKKMGAIFITAQTIIDQVNLNNSTLILDGELIVKQLDFGNGAVIFTSNSQSHPLTLTESSTIWNTSEIHTSGTIPYTYYDDPDDSEATTENGNAVAGQITIKDGMTLTFAKADGSDANFASDQLTVNVENGAQAVFDSDSVSVSFNTLNMTKGTAEVKSGTLNVDNVTFGNVIDPGTLTIDSGAQANITTLTATKGSTVNIDGTLTVTTNLETQGDQVEMGTLTGSGTLIITGTANLEGYTAMDGDSSWVKVEGTEEQNRATANFNSQTGKPDIIGNMRVEYGVVNLQNGTLEINELTMDHGTINLVNEDVVLSLKQNPGQMSGTGNSIGGKGKLRLMDGVDINFGGTTGGALSYLGGLQIGTGTATITSDTSLGGVEFMSADGGSLAIKSEKMLTLTSNPSLNSNEYFCDRKDNCSIKSMKANVIGGEQEGTKGGTLNLVDGNGSVFAGKVLLDQLNFGGWHKTGETSSFETGTMTFSFTGESEIGTFNFGYLDKDETVITNRTSDATVIVNTGTLTIQQAFEGNREITPNVYGTGTLRLLKGGTIKNDYNSTTNTDHYLANLMVGNGGPLNIAGGGFKNISFTDPTSGTINLTGSITVLNTIQVNKGNTITSDASALMLSGTTAKGYFYSSLSGLNMLTVEKGATAYINADTQIGDGIGLNLEAGSDGGQKSTVNIAKEKTLTFSGDNLGPDESSPTTLITGNGTLKLAGITNVRSSLNGLKNLTIANGGNATIQHDAVLTGDLTAKVATEDSADISLEFKKNTSISGDVKVLGNNDKTSTITFSGGNNTIGGTMTVAKGTVMLAGGTENNIKKTTVSNVVFSDTAGTLNLGNAYTILNVTSDITVGDGNTLGGTGTINLSGTANGTFAMGADFGGTVKIGQGTANIQTNKSFGAIGFASSDGGTLNIAETYILSVGQINTNGTNSITGKGTLNLTHKEDDEGNQLVSSFKAPLSNLNKFQITGGAAKLYNTISIDRIDFMDGGYINLADPSAVLSVKQITQTNSPGAIYGVGSFVAVGAHSDTVKLSTGGNFLTSAMVGEGTIDFVGDSKIGTLKYSSVVGTINIQNDVTVTVTSEFSGKGDLTGDSRGTLYLQGKANAQFEHANGFHGIINADEGTLVFGNTTTNFDQLTLKNAKTYFNQDATINVVSVKDGLVSFRESANLSSLTVRGTGEALFSKEGRGTVQIGSFNVAAGKLTFEKDATNSNGGSINGGTLSLDVNKLTVQSDQLVFEDSSKYAMRISRRAVDDAGVVQDSGYGRIVLGEGAKLIVRNNVTLDLKIDYGVRTAEDGTVFQVSQGNTEGEFIFKNNRYKFEKEGGETTSGLRYRLTEVFNAGEYAQSESGNNNQVGTASAFLDGELFDYGTKAFDVAEHLDALSQHSSSSSYLNALTALAPDVTNAMSRQPIALQGKIAGTVSGRMNGLLGNLGSSSRTYRDIQKMYGRSGGSPYRSRFMRSSDYYRRAGYYDQDDQPTTRKRPAYRRRLEPDSQEASEVTTERKRWSKRNTNYSRAKDFGVWGQTFFNQTEYLSSNKPDGFSGDTTGFAVGADVQLFDVFALGLGYSATSSTIDSLQRSTDVDGNSFFIYGMYKPSDWFVSSVLNMTSMSYTESKDISGMTIKDTYDGSSFGASLMIGKDLKTWTPSFGIRYVSSDRDAHKDDIGQDISSISTDVLTFVAEGRWNRDFAKKNDSYWHSELSAAATYDISASSEDAVINLPNGSTYTVAGDDFSNMGVELGASLAWVYGDHVDVSAGYNMEWRPDYLSHTLMATFRYSF